MAAHLQQAPAAQRPSRLVLALPRCALLEGTNAQAFNPRSALTMRKICPIAATALSGCVEFVTLGPRHAPNPARKITEVKDP